MEIDDKLLLELRERFFDIVMREDGRIHNIIIESFKTEDDKDEYIRFIQSIGVISYKVRMVSLPKNTKE